MMITYGIIMTMYVIILLLVSGFRLLFQHGLTDTLMMILKSQQRVCIFLYFLYISWTQVACIFSHLRTGESMAFCNFL